MNDLDSMSIFVYISELERENKQLKDNYNSIKEYLKNDYDKYKDEEKSLSVIAYHSLSILGIMEELEGK